MTGAMEQPKNSTALGETTKLAGDVSWAKSSTSMFLNVRTLKIAATQFSAIQAKGMLLNRTLRTSPKVPLPSMLTISKPFKLWSCPARASLAGESGAMLCEVLRVHQFGKFEVVPLAPWNFKQSVGQATLLNWKVSLSVGHFTLLVSAPKALAKPSFANCECLPQHHLYSFPRPHWHASQLAAASGGTEWWCNAHAPQACCFWATWTPLTVTLRVWTQSWMLSRMLNPCWSSWGKRTGKRSTSVSTCESSHRKLPLCHCLALAPSKTSSRGHWCSTIWFITSRTTSLWSGEMKMWKIKQCSTHFIGHILSPSSFLVDLGVLLFAPPKSSKSLGTARPQRLRWPSLSNKAGENCAHSLCCRAGRWLQLKTEWAFVWASWLGPCFLDSLPPGLSSKCTGVNICKNLVKHLLRSTISVEWSSALKFFSKSERLTLHPPCKALQAAARQQQKIHSWASRVLPLSWTHEACQQWQLCDSCDG